MYVRAHLFSFAALLLGLFVSLSAAQDDTNEALIEMVVEFLSEEDNDIRSLAFDQIRTEAPGQAATKTFAGKLSDLPDEAKVGLLSALADRGDVAAKEAVIQTLEASQNEAVTTAAIKALGKLGDASDCPKLISLLADDDMHAAARESLVQLQGDSVSSAIVRGIDRSKTPNKVALIEVLTIRRALDAIPKLLKLAVGDNSDVRTTAMNALGQLAGPEHISGMAKSFLMATSESERANAEKNIMFVCNRIEPKDKQADPLLRTMKSLSRWNRTKLLPALGRIGGKPALDEIERAIRSRIPTLHSAGIRAISNWPNASVADRLIAIAKNNPRSSNRRIARMALTRIAPLPDGRTDAQKLELLKKSLKLAESDAERSYAIKRAAAIRLPATLRFVLPYVDQPKFAEQACLTVVELAHHRQLRDDNKAEFHAALDKVIATSKDSVVVDRAHRYKNGQTWVRPK